MDTTELIDQPVANSLASENNPDVDEAISDAQAVAQVMPTRGRTGLLDLPAELRVMIFRHLLLRCHCIHFPGIVHDTRPRIPVNILRTNRLIHREAFDVLYREKYFATCEWLTITPSPRVMDTIQNMYVAVHMEILVATGG